MQEKINKIVKKENKILFYVPDTQGQILASIYEIYLHATTLKNSGYNVMLVSDTNDYQQPDWFNDNLIDLKVLTPKVIEEEKIEISAEDIIITPEYFVNFLEQIKNLPAKKVLWFQGIESYLKRFKHPQKSLLFKLTRYYDIHTILFNSEKTKQFFTDNYILDSEDFEYHVINPTIPDYFKQEEKIKSLKVGLYGRNIFELHKVVEIFLNRYPEFQFISFEPVQGTMTNPKTNRKDFAESLSTFPICLWIDDDATFGTFPLECMLSRTIPVGKIGKYELEYLTDEKFKDYFKGFWSSYTVGKKENGEYNDLVEKLNTCISYYLEDEITPKLYEQMKVIASNYIDTTEKRDNIVFEYQKMIDSRKIELEQFTNKKETENA